MDTVKIKQIDYKGWKDCVHMSNGIVELVLVTAVGPRIIHYGFAGDENMFYVNENQIGQTGGDIWKNYGGHRLWHGPQEGYRPNEPDNEPVRVEISGNTVHLIQNTEKNARMEKKISITMSPDSTEVILNHEMVNHNIWPVKYTVWALTQMRPGGRSIVPVKRPESGFLSNFAFVHWGFSRIDDRRLQIRKEHIALDFEDGNSQWFKLGFENRDGWAAYFYQNTAFVKNFDFQEEAEYPDRGCNYETYVDDEFMELESLSPIRVVQPEHSITHQERWMLLKDIRIPETEDEVENFRKRIGKN